MNKLKLGVIGISEGNGHPFSWSAIFNGYELDEIKKCGFPVIPKYLSAQSFPGDFLTELGEVTHVWTQNRTTSDQIAKASRISNIAEKPEDLIGAVDAILLARDDAENHSKMAIPFLEAGLPVFIDKPFALNLKDANEMIDLQTDKHQIFTCSSLRYAKELIISSKEKEELGEIKYIEASVPKYWETYAVHVLEPIIVNCPDRGRLRGSKAASKNGVKQALIKWENLVAYVKCTGNLPTKLQVSFFGEKGKVVKEFKDSFSCFKSSLEKFIYQIKRQELIIPRSETLEIVEIIQKGIYE